MNALAKTQRILSSTKTGAALEHAVHRRIRVLDASGISGRGARYLVSKLQFQQTSAAFLQTGLPAFMPRRHTVASSGSDNVLCRFLAN